MFQKKWLFLVAAFYFLFINLSPANADLVTDGQNYLNCTSTEWKDDGQQCTVTVKNSSGVIPHAQLNLKSFDWFDGNGNQTATVQISTDNNGKAIFCSYPPDAVTQNPNDPNNLKALQQIDVSASGNSSVSKTVPSGTNDVCSAVGSTITLQGGVQTYSYICTQNGTCQAGTSQPDTANLGPVYTSSKSDADAKSQCDSQCGTFGFETATSACVDLSPTYPDLTAIKSAGGQDSTGLTQFKAFYPTAMACKNDKYGVLFSSLPKNVPSPTPEPPTPTPTDTPIPPQPPCFSKTTVTTYHGNPTPIPSILPPPPGTTPIPTPTAIPAFPRFVGCGSVFTGLGFEISTYPTVLIKDLFGILLSLSGGIAILLIMKSGYQMMTAQGDHEKIKEARDVLTSAIIGLLFLIFSLIILQIIGVDILHIPGLRP